MLLRVTRDIFASDFTLGRFYIDGELFFYTCEDAIRKEKVMHETAIPVGDYKVIIDWSQRFQKHLPHVLDVPGFEGIRIHSGNTAADTSGCILIGLTRTKTGVQGSRLAMQDFMPRLEYGLLKGDVYLSVA